MGRGSWIGQRTRASGQLREGLGKFGPAAGKPWKVGVSGKVALDGLLRTHLPGMPRITKSG